MAGADAALSLEIGGQPGPEERAARSNALLDKASDLFGRGMIVIDDDE